MAEENRTLNETTETAEAAAGAADEAAQDMEILNLEEEGK